MLRALFSLSLIASAETARADCQFATPEEPVAAADIPASVIEAAQLGPNGRDVLSDVAGGVYVSRQDLNGDGVPEACYNLATSVTCSNGVVVCLHVITDGDDAKVLWSDAVHMVTALPGPHSGEYQSLLAIWYSSMLDLTAQALIFGPDGYDAGPNAELGSALR